MEISGIVDLESYPLFDLEFQKKCRMTLDGEGLLSLTQFIQSDALADMLAESLRLRGQAYFCQQTHSVYLNSPDVSLPSSHPLNRTVLTSKGCVCDDLIASDSPLRSLYESSLFREFVKTVVGQTEIYPYADRLSSINIHYAERNQELGWHFDNSSFAITLMIQKPGAGGRFEFINDFRNSGSGEENYSGVSELLDGGIQPDQLEIDPGTLILFRGKNSLHRVSPNLSDQTRILAVLAYNSLPGVALSESARKTFYGRLN
ncbi:MAG: HalD/BesD family halogenase [Mariniblastus sp.]